MRHRTVARDGSFEYLVGIYLSALACPFDQWIDRVQYPLLELLAAGIIGSEYDAGNYILTAGDLTVVFGYLGFYFAGGKVNQPAGDGGGADVNGNTIYGITFSLMAWKQGNQAFRRTASIDLYLCIQDSSDLPVTLPENSPQCLEQGKGDKNILNLGSLA
jgi:hypothetical protein